MSDKLALAAKARAMIEQTDGNAVRAGLHEIAEALEATGRLPDMAMHDFYEAADRPFVDALHDKLLLAAIYDSDFGTIISALRAG
jgi:hypothetical protein